MTVTNGVQAEEARLAVLRGHRIMDTEAEPEFDDIALLAAEICGTPIAMVSLVDDERQWFKARVGVPYDEGCRDSAFCAHALEQQDVLEVPDAVSDPRFATNPLVLGEPFIRFYAGAPLRVEGGVSLGTVCVVDHQPRTLTPSQRRALRALARHAAAEIELRSYARRTADVNRRVVELEDLKNRILTTVSHELRTPLSSIRGYLELLLDDADPLDQETGRDFLAVIQRNAHRLTSLVDDMLLATKVGSEGIEVVRVPIDLADLVAAVVAGSRPLAEHKGLEVSFEKPGPVIVAGSHRELTQALQHVVLNAIKFTTDGAITVQVTGEPRPTVIVTDTGTGIDEGEIPRLFDPFYRSETAEAAAIQGPGLGLTLVRAIVNAHGGQVDLRSRLGAGTTVVLQFPPSAEVLV
ncbi:GAF domain-containing sensor histidine kinase [Cryptosporangium aurantiacum]|uniref:histidine kinase n=1 Tax=Cryptosporangium aurantiacum TaxID=134849 RepID=A0A1M7MKB1_9ACTN|nr:GAF domain-containing sensor histidine kinase [Cryptosporangium aurantiacum]SHM90890.1 Signal transduction histidine kinase [Cryptosporangium aurantiacum]